VARDGAVPGLGRAGADHHLWRDEPVLALPGPGAWDAQRAAGAQAGDELALESAAALDIQGLVDGLVRDPHRFIIGEIDREPAGDLLRAPCRAPSAVLAAAVPPAVE